MPVSADFVAELLGRGSIRVPALLIRHYLSLGLRPDELILLLQILFHQQTGEIGHSSAQQLGQTMGLGAVEVEDMIRSLEGKAIIKIQADRASGDADLDLCWEGLLGQLQNVWLAASDLQTSAVETAAAADSAGLLDGPAHVEEIAALYRAFENEFGRALSPMEGGQIVHWYHSEQFSAELVMEALRQAVLRGVLNFKYVDSILRGWRKKGLRTMAEVQRQEAQFQERRSQMERPAREKAASRTDKSKGSKEKKDKFAGLYLS